jgi:hypothetical protein
MIAQLEATPADEAVATVIAALLGENDVSTSPEEIGWAFRKLLEQETPLLVVVDDIQWGEETFLDLLEQTALRSTGVPLLLVCLARPELEELRPTWPVSLRLAPLPPADAALLLPATAPQPLRERIAHAAGGNPLFLTEMTAMVAGGADEVVVPSSLKALLASRLDQLDVPQREVLERGAVEGELFHRGSVLALAPAETEVGRELAALVRKQLIRPDRATVPGEDGFRFCHLLMRDAAYGAPPKMTRFELHERHADWLTEHAISDVERDELVGYHLEQACHYRQELVPDDPGLAAIATRAAESLAAAGDRAISRLDPAAVNLLGRARALLPQKYARLEIEFAAALRLFTGHGQQGVQLLEETAAQAAAAGDRSSELEARLGLLEPGGWGWCEQEAASQLPLVEEALEHFQRVGDETGLMRAWIAAAMIERVACRMGASIEAAELALSLARTTRQRRAETSLTIMLSSGGLWGPTPAHDALSWLDGLPAVYRYNPSFIAHRAAFQAMRGQFELARSLQAIATAYWEQRNPLMHEAITQVLYDIEILAGNPAAAEPVIRRICEQLENAGNHGVLSTDIAHHARTLSQLKRHDEAETCSLRSEELGEPDDMLAQILWRQTRATVYAHQGRGAEAQQLGREAVEIASRTDLLNAHGDALLDLAAVLEITSGRQGA